ncbi:MAG: hypothetical protein J5934_00480 [Succinivibrio sp.]|nr:hypothetical protein [Succinivibrio sp.]
MIFNTERVVWHLKNSDGSRAAAISAVPGHSEESTPSEDTETKAPLSAPESSAEEKVEPLMDAEPEDIKAQAADIPVSAPGVSVAAEISPASAPVNRARWKNLPYHLRSKRADVFLKKNSSADFVASLETYLKSRGIAVLPYDDSLCYLPSDVLLIDSTDEILQGTAVYLDHGRREVWEFLKKEYPKLSEE